MFWVTWDPDTSEHLCKKIQAQILFYYHPFSLIAHLQNHEFPLLPYSEMPISVTHSQRQVNVVTLISTEKLHRGYCGLVF